MTMNDMESLKSFANRWLASWTGNFPDRLIEFYTPDVFYLDPANPKGICGKENLYTYFKKILYKNPSWLWATEEIFPTKNGFTLKWKANIPVEEETITVMGLDIIELLGNKISRNEVYFDRYKWLTMLRHIK